VLFIIVENTVFKMLHSGCEKYLTVKHIDNSVVAIMIWTLT